MFLTSDELYALTDLRQKAKQAEWLRARAWPFELSASGRPKVLREYATKRLGGTHDSAPAAVITPNFEVLL